MRTSRHDICVIGMGRFGKSIVDELIRLRRYVFALDIDETKLDSITSVANEVAVVDASDITGLKGLGVNSFDTVVIAVSNNITIAATLLELGIKHVIAKAENPRQERVLKLIGVDVIIKPEIDAGIKTALIAANNEFIKYSKTVEEIGDDYTILSTELLNEQWTNKPLEELAFTKNGINIISIKRNGKIFLPTGQLQLNINDLLTLIGKNKSLIKILDILAIKK